ncbi:MAG TPA: hypothetical protein VMV86_02170, partial [Methanosarcinales archaeon]|nr:hypothetical protein [Methanosarcinales archaeon]
NGRPKPSPNSLNTYIVSDIKYSHFMLRMGFRPGSQQNNDKIITLIPTIYKDAFDKGYDFAQK